MSEFLVSFSPVSLPRWAVFIQGHIILSLRVRVFVQGGGIGVVPVFFKLFPENTFTCEFLLWGWENKAKPIIWLFSPSHLAGGEPWNSNSTLIFENFSPISWYYWGILFPSSTKQSCLYHLHFLSWATQAYFINRWDLSWRPETGGDGLTWLLDPKIFLSLRISAMVSHEFPPYLGLMMFKSIKITVNHVNWQAKALGLYKVPWEVNCDLSWWRVSGLSVGRLRKQLHEKFPQSGYLKLAVPRSLASVPSHTWCRRHTTFWGCRYWVLRTGLSLRCQGKMCFDFKGCRQPESMLCDSKAKATSWYPIHHSLALG